LPRTISQRSAGIALHCGGGHTASLETAGVTSPRAAQRDARRKQRSHRKREQQPPQRSANAEQHISKSNA